MPEFPITLVPVGGGLAAHTSDCGCPENTATAGRRAYVASSIASAVVQHMERWPLAAHGDRTVRRECAANIPEQEIAPLTWGQRHQLYVNKAAHAVAALAREYARTAERVEAFLLDSRADRMGQPVPLWAPRPGHVSETLRATHAARALAYVMDGVDYENADDDDLQRIVTQAESMLRTQTELLMETNVQYADAMERAYGEIERQAAGQVTRALRSALSEVRAHYSLRAAEL